MSRCFPFPPPGYERKYTPEDLDLLKEAKSKEKKHKKEKKDKERKKDKEKEKGGSTEKHRDKKDRKDKEKHKDKKEKHRDKKKDNKEDRGKDKDKSSISEESSVSRSAEISEPKLYPVANNNDRSNLPNEVKCYALLQDQKNGGNPSRNEESKFVQELDRRIKDEKIRGSQLPERVAVADKKDRMPAVRNSSGVLAEEKGDNINNRVDKKVDPQGLKNEFSGNKVAQNLTMPAVKSKGEGMIPRPVSEVNGWRLGDKEKCQETVVGIKQGDKEKAKSRGKDKEKDKEKRKNEKDEKAKLKGEHKKIEREKLKVDGSRNNNLVGFAVNKSTKIFKVDGGNAVNEGNIKKRKDMGTNGFLHENEIRPNKIQKPPLHQSSENGRKLDHFPTPPKPFNDNHPLPNTVRVETKDQSMINGTLEAPRPTPFKPNPPDIATMVIDQTPEPSKFLPQCDSKKAAVSKMEDIVFTESLRRSPHPDSKYLAEVLTVPEKLSDCFDNDEQDWLFSEKVESKAKVGPVGEDVRVWSEAVHIESADVCALPYVIPY
ncbi:hypothetical protein CASFOL_034878 [Castilleja foliolosa]|uniref:Myb-like protein X n=1 Tax=Castilleja foliolosa TaxID=1961234 RepID=A0ABD3BS95_9LAMI